MIVRVVVIVMPDQMMVYCAGPHYNPEEKYGMEQIARMIEASGFRTYLPHRDGIELGPPVEAFEFLARAHFASEVYQATRRSSAVLFNMNGRVPDEGAVFLSSLAYMTGKPVFLYKNDNRSIFHGNDNSMILGLSTNFHTVKKLNRIPKELCRILNKADNPDAAGRNMENGHGYLQKVARYGKKVWDLWTDIRMKKTESRDSAGCLLLLKKRLEREIPVSL